MKSKILTALLAAVIAVALWTYVITVERPESENTYRNVPVVLEGVEVLKDRGLMITGDYQTTVTLKLSGQRKELNNLKSSDISAAVDMTRVYEAGEKNLTYTVYAPGVGSFEVVTRYPDTIRLKVTEWATKEIPVELSFTGKVSDGYSEDRQNATVDVEKLNINGPKDIISQIKKAVLTVDLNGASQTISEVMRYTLCDEEGNPIEDVSSVETDRAEIRATVSVQQMKELELTYTIVEGGGLKETDAVVTLDYDTVTVSGSPAVLQDLEQVDLGEVDLGKIVESTELVFPIELPEGVVNRSGFTEVRMSVQVPKLGTKEFTVTQFQLENVPEGRTAQVYTQVLTVTLRGRTSILDRIKPEHITAVADLSAEEGDIREVTVSFEIEGFDGIDNLGAVDTYKITVRLFDEVEGPVLPPRAAA